MAKRKDIFSPDRRREIMSKTGHQQSAAEKNLEKLLRRRGIRARPHPNMLGKPDFYWVKEKVAFFADGDFWHGHNFSKVKNKLDSFWQKKIIGNAVRDERINRQLRKIGVIPFRFWESELRKSEKANKKLKGLLLKLSKRRNKLRIV